MGPAGWQRRAELDGQEPDGWKHDLACRQDGDGRWGCKKAWIAVLDLFPRLV